MTRHFVLPAILIGMLTVSSGCDFGSPGRSDLAALELEILALIGDAQSTDVSFCREIAFGSKPCGGPWRYLAYSAVATDTLVLAQKVDRYNRWEKEINEREGTISDCAFVAPPGVKLESGKCKLRTD